MNRLVGVALAVGLVLFVSALVLAVANAWWPVVAAQMAAGWLATGGWALYRENANLKRWRATRALLVVAYEEGHGSVTLHSVASVIGGEEVRAAQRKYASVLASRYANGDASDY